MHFKKGKSWTNGLIPAVSQGIAICLQLRKKKSGREYNAYLEPLLEEGVRYFGVGGALGFDTLVAEKLLTLRESRPQIRIILVQPFQGYQSCWTPAQQARAAAVEAGVGKVVVCGQTLSREAFLARDRHLVDGYSCCIAWCTRAIGGTACTLRYAQRQGLRVWNVAQCGERG